MRAMMALVLHLGGVGECVRLIWEWSVHNQESGDLHHRTSPLPLNSVFIVHRARHHCPPTTLLNAQVQCHHPQSPLSNAIFAAVTLPPLLNVVKRCHCDKHPCSPPLSSITTVKHRHWLHSHQLRHCQLRRRRCCSSPPSNADAHCKTCHRQTLTPATMT
jgi:hypothetical protein